MREARRRDMGKVGLLKKACILLAILAAVAIAASAQTFNNLFSFDSTDGSGPSALMQAADGNFYGTTYAGGTSTNCSFGCGSIFQISPGGVVTTLHSFDSTDGSGPSTLMQATDGNFYGTTSAGGTYGCGTVFKVTSAGILTTVHSFSSEAYCVDGEILNAGLIQAADGNFYGKRAHGGSGFGTVFTITPEGILTTVHSFNSTDGIAPHGGLIQATDGKFYGTTSGGGAYNSGTTFQVTSAGELTVLHSFCARAGCPDGASPQAGLIQASDGNFYGTTYAGGAHQYGTVFSIASTGTLETLYSFCAETGCHDGTHPNGLIQANDGTFYGTTYSGGAYQYGTVFEISGLTLATQHSFDSTDGA